MDTGHSFLANITIYRDDWIWVLNKPANLLSVPGNSKQPNRQQNLLSCIRKHAPEAAAVHRLDEPTSGIMVFALQKSVEQKLHQQFRSKQVIKRYIAVIDGHLPNAFGTIQLPVARDWPNRPKQTIHFHRGKPSLTQWKVLREDTFSSRIALFPLTGKTHQLRIHLASIGNAILGDPLYAPSKPCHRFCQRLLLHAQTLQFRHPIVNVNYCFHAPVSF